MGSSLGPVLANIFMCHFEEEWVFNNNNARPSIWFRYVDDTFTLFDSKNTAPQFLHYLNNCHANIKFSKLRAVFLLFFSSSSSVRASSSEAGARREKRGRQPEKIKRVSLFSYLSRPRLQSRACASSHDMFDVRRTYCKIKETLLIRELKPTLNDEVSSEKLYLY